MRGKDADSKAIARGGGKPRNTRMYTRSLFFARLAVLSNAAMALGKIVMGVYTLSVFLMISGLYNIGIGSAKLISVKSYNDNRKIPGARRPGGCEREYRYYYIAGVIILLTSLIYMVYCVIMLMDGHGNVQYSNVVAITIATVTFAELGLSVHGIIVTRRDGEPAMEAIKLTNLVSSLISLVLAQAAIMSFAYDGDASFHTGITGIVFGSWSALIGLYMMMHIKRVMRGRDGASVMRRVNGVVKKRAPGLIEEVKFVDNGPGARVVYLKTVAAGAVGEETIEEITEIIQAARNVEVVFIEGGRRV